MRKQQLFPLWLLVLSSAAIAADKPAVNGDRIQQHITALSKYGANPEGGVSRVAFSDADIAGHKYVNGLMREAGLNIRTYAACNMIGRREGTNPKLPAILIGSHIDSVPSGGNYDGDV